MGRWVSYRLHGAQTGQGKDSLWTVLGRTGAVLCCVVLCWVWDWVLEWVWLDKVCDTEPMRPASGRHSLYSQGPLEAMQGHQPNSEGLGFQAGRRLS